MKKRLISLLLVLCLMLSLLPVLPVGAARSDTDIPYAVEGGNIYFDKETGTVTGCDFSVTRADIPDEIDGVAVTAIGDSALFNCTSLTDVTIPDSVTTIGDRAFSYCGSLKSIEVSSANPNYSSKDGVLFDKTQTVLYQCPGGKAGAFEIPDSVTTIGGAAFANCTGLTAVTIPNSVTTISEYAFAGCGNLTAVTIPDGVTTISEYAFSYCASLTDVAIPDSVTTIGNEAFTLCTGLTAVTIPNSVTTIGDNAFRECTGLTDVTIGDSVTTIGGAAFWDCNSLTEVTIGDGVTTIGGSAFWHCYNLTEVTIPDSVTTIEIAAFSACTSLTEVTIGDGVTTIGDDAFYYCDNLTAVYFRGDAPELGEHVFQTGGYDNWSNIPGLTIYYIEGKSGWTSPTWNDYPTATWDGKTGDLKPDDPTPDKPSTPTFNDVPANAWYTEAVHYAVEHQLMNGMGNNEFQPNTSMTRAMLVTVLWRYAEALKKERIPSPT